MKTFKLKDYPKQISVANKALFYNNDKFLSVFKNASKRTGIMATDEEILAWRDIEKEKRFPKQKEKETLEQKQEENPKKNIKKAAEK